MAWVDAPPRTPRRSVASRPAPGPPRMSAAQQAEAFDAFVAASGLG